MPSDEDSDLHPQDPHRCANERRIRTIERKLDAHDERLMEGTRTMDRLSASVESLTKSVDLLNTKIIDQSKPNPWLERIGTAIITTLVPILVVMIVWAAVSSGAIPIKLPAPSTPPPSVHP